MNILTRLSDLISVNVHAMLDGAENPERMLAHLLRAMEEGLVSARQQAATAITAERRLRRELDQCLVDAEHWKEQALRALARGREDLARRALGHKIDHDSLAAALEVQHRTAQELSVEVKTALHALQRRLAEARRRLALVLARRRAAQVRLEVERTLGPGLANVAAPFSRFDQLERWLADHADDLLAQVEVNHLDGDLEAELDGLDRTRRIEEELRNLRKEEGNLEE